MEMHTSPTGMAAAQAVLSKSDGRGVPSRAGVPAATAPAAPAPRRTGYGLPCALCNTYYEADLSACPMCQSPERAAPRSIVLPAAPITPVENAGAEVLENAPALEILEEERERFLRELKTQLYQTPMRIHTGATTCALESGHLEAPGDAEICRACYEQMQRCADRMEAALHMDLKEAAKIIYEAVWADTSDSDKTYLNAAQALLNELRNRAGISATPGFPPDYN